MGTLVDNIEGLTPADKAILKAHRINSAEEFWAAMASNPMFVAMLNLPDGTATRRVLHKLARVAKKQAQAITKNWFVIHIADLVITAVIVSSIVYVTWVQEVRCFFRRAELFVNGPRYVVAAPTGLAPFQIINASDVELSDGTTPGVPQDLIGRYPNKEIPHGAVIDTSKLSSGIRLSSLEGFRVLSVKVQPTEVLAGVRPPAKISILLSPRVKDQHAPLIFNAYVLDFRSQTDGMLAVVAVPEDNFQKLAPILPQSELVAIGPVRKDR